MKLTWEKKMWNVNTLRSDVHPQVRCAPSGVHPQACTLTQACTLRRAPSGVRPQMCALRHAPSGVRPQACTLRRAPSDVHPQACTLRRAPSGVHPQACTLRRAPSGVHPQVCTLRRAPSGGACSIIMSLYPCPSPSLSLSLIPYSCSPRSPSLWTCWRRLFQSGGVCTRHCPC